MVEVRGVESPCMDVPWNVGVPYEGSFHGSGRSYRMAVVVRMVRASLYADTGTTYDARVVFVVEVHG
jgi:hypothetical protein